MIKKIRECVRSRLITRALIAYNEAGQSSGSAKSNMSKLMHYILLNWKKPKVLFPVHDQRGIKE